MPNNLHDLPHTLTMPCPYGCADGIEIPAELSTAHDQPGALHVVGVPTVHTCAKRPTAWANGLYLMRHPDGTIIGRERDAEQWPEKPWGGVGTDADMVEAGMILVPVAVIESPDPPERAHLSIPGADLAGSLNRARRNGWRQR